jgi:hypothetical protein
MAKAKFDGVIESVHYAPDGSLAWARIYERRGPTFSDWVLLDRAGLVERLKAGKKFVLGRRVEYLSSTFEVSQPVRLEQRDGSEVIVAGDNALGKGDSLPGAPVV